MIPATAADRQLLTSHLEDIQIELGYLRQCAGDILERIDIANAQMKTITDILDHGHGHQAPPDATLTE